jgi:acyl-coenzyme A synthetase/AMP-(fatty) acid ligase
MSKQAIFNYPSLDSAVIYHQGKVICLRELVQTVNQLASIIPKHHYVLNLYDDRYYFLLGFLLALKQQSISLFPSTVTTYTLKYLKEYYHDMVIFSDSSLKTDNNEYYNLAEILSTISTSSAKRVDSAIYEIELTQYIAIVFTSGTTGQPKPYTKQWQDLLCITRLLAKKLLPTAKITTLRAILATVPAQHMYGLEFSIIMALQQGLLIHANKPFFPQDITSDLEQLADYAHQHDQSIATTLITTPLHLKACIKTNIVLPGVKQFISATAPLEFELANLCVTHYDASILEIFGCTEVGSIAWRETIHEKKWTVLDDIYLEAIPHKEIKRNTYKYSDVQINTNRSIKHFIFNDIIELLDSKHFILKGRKEDLINLAGKRTSLAYLNYHLQSYPELKDACYFQDESSSTIRLVAFIVLKITVLKTTKLKISEEKKLIIALNNFLKKRMDAIFLPKKIYIIKQLPRNKTGKLPILALKKLLKTQKNTSLSFNSTLLIDVKHPSLAGHFPENPIVPGVVILDQVIRQWQQRSHQQIQHIQQVKFMTLLKPNVCCTINYQENNKQGINFILMDNKKKIIAKGLFSYA